MKKENYYIDPDDLKDAVKEMREKGVMTERFGKYLLDIQERVLDFPRFVRYHDEIKDELRLYNIERWCRRGWKYIKEEGNPFSYITTGCFLNFLDALTRYFKQQQKQEELVKILMEEAKIENDAAGVATDQTIKDFLREDDYDD